MDVLLRQLRTLQKLLRRRGATPEQAADIYSRIFSDIKRRYIIGYYPTNGEQDGKRRKINVEIRDHPEYVVWGRKSYVASNR